MIKNINRNISVWRGNDTPPTDYHLWVKDDGTTLIKQKLEDGSEIWMIQDSPSTGDEINVSNLLGDYAINLDTIFQILATEGVTKYGIKLHPGVKITFKEATSGKWQTYLYRNELSIDYSNPDNWKLVETEDNEDQLQDQINKLSIMEVSPEDNTILTSYELKDRSGSTHGTRINIPKDKAIKDVQILDMNATIDEDGTLVAGDPVGNTALCIVYIISDGSYKLVKLDYQRFLEENEFLDGLELKEHKIYVKIDPTSESFLTVSINGVKISGVQTAIYTSIDSSNALSQNVHLGNNTVTPSADNVNITTNTISYSNETHAFINSDSITTTIPAATNDTAGVLTSTNKKNLDTSFDRTNQIWDGNLAMPPVAITGTWTFYNNAGTVTADLSPTPNANNPIIENGYKATFTGTYKWAHEDGKKDPESATSDSNWKDLPASGVNSSSYTSPTLTTTTTIKARVQAAKTGLMVKSNGVDIGPATGYDYMQDTRTVTFRHRLYYGNTTNTTMTESVIESLTGNELVSSRASTKSGISSTTSQYYVYAYPKDLGALTTIIQDGATPVLGAFTRSEVLITNAAGLSITYYVYRSNNPGAFTNVKLQFQ